MTKRPLTVTVLGWLLIVTGAIGLAAQVYNLWTAHAFADEDIWIALVRALAIVAGAFLLRGLNWARWLALAWSAFHVAISFLNSPQQVVVHGLLLVLFAWLLYRSDARAYFRPPQPPA